jgi:23S rRNA (adenine2030-N6)-methyltransferase
MNYRHVYHAGNFADVVKHAVLTLILAHLRKKDTPFCVIDTHAGIGRYDLTGVEANKTKEFQGGIGKLAAAGDASPALAGYLDAVKAVNPRWPQVDTYPGSPCIARQFLRPIDRMAVVELHAEDAVTLRREFAGDAQVGVHVADAYVALKALLPPKERRGLVLIDPPFEVEDEFRLVAKGLDEALKRWATGIYAIWYPIKLRDPVERFLGEIAACGRPCLTAELCRHPPGTNDRLNGCGIAVLNPPWQLDETLGDMLPVLAARLEAAGGAEVRWLIGNQHISQF